MFGRRLTQIGPYLLPDYEAWRIRFANTYNDVLHDFVFFAEEQQLRYALLSIIPSDHDSLVMTFFQTLYPWENDDGPVGAL